MYQPIKAGEFMNPHPIAVKPLNGFKLIITFKNKNKEW
jgi:hypothetical protein